MSDEKIAGVMQAVTDLKAKGVTALKVELEAQLGRRQFSEDTGNCEYCDEGQNECGDCNGTGTWGCGDCGGDGFTLERGIRTACENCEASGEVACEWCDEGYNTCSDCDGNWEGENPTGRNWSSNQVCMEWLLERVAEKTDSTLDRGGFMGDGITQNPFTWIRYAKFYYDGSVDSEITFTVPLDNDENVMHLPSVLEAFKELAEEIGGSFDVTGAGMHMATLFSPDASYPHAEDDFPREPDPRYMDYDRNSNRLPEVKLENFRRAMTQLLPALYFLASTNENSRALRYRMPRISTSARTDRFGDGQGAKYSAIAYRYGSFEFRVFDTCYDEPEVVLDNLVVMANCHKFLTTRFKSPGINKLAREIRFGSDVNNKLDRFYCTEQHIDVLEAGLKVIKPSYYTLDEVRSKRKFERTKESVKNLRAETEKNILIEYEEYEERNNWRLRLSEQSYRAQLLQSMIQEIPVNELRRLTMEELEARVAERVQNLLRHERSGITDKDRYIRDRMSSYERNMVGQYTLNFN